MNARRLRNEFNILEGLESNPLFVVIVITITFLQVKNLKKAEILIIISNIKN